MPMPKQKPGRSRSDYETPNEFIAAVKQLLKIERFAHDFAADRFNTKAQRFFDEERDALSVDDWAIHVGTGWGWLNPPFSNIQPWAAACAQMREQGGKIAFLTPASVGANWFRDHVHGQAYVLFLNGRIAFDPKNPTWGYPKDCILSLFGPKIEPGYDVWTWTK